MSPKTMPPIKAPGMLPRPDIAVMAKAFKVSGAPMKGKIAWVGLMSIPASPVRATQMAKVRA